MIIKYMEQCQVPNHEARSAVITSLNLFKIVRESSLEATSKKIIRLLNKTSP